MNVQDLAPAPQTIWQEQVERWLMPRSKKLARGIGVTEEDGQGPGRAPLAQPAPSWPRVFPGL